MDYSDVHDRLAEEHLARMSALGWKAFSSALAEGRRGETFGCELDGLYFDVGDSAAWADVEGSDIILTTFAQSADGRRSERTVRLRQSHYKRTPGLK